MSGIFPTWSKSQNTPKELQFDNIPATLKAQVVHICDRFYSQVMLEDEVRRHIWKETGNTILEEHGLTEFRPTLFSQNMLKHSLDYLETLEDVNKALDVIHIIFWYIEKMEWCVNQSYSWPITLNYTASQAIEDLNTRFKEHAVGYEYRDRQINRVDNELLHQNTVTPALDLLLDPDYKTANDEYLKGLSYLRKNEIKDCLTWITSALESSIKIIAKKNNWTYRENMTISPLINLLFENSFLPPHREQALHAIKTFMAYSIPQPRNSSSSAHGDGNEPVEPPLSLAVYMTHLIGATIRFLLETQKELEVSLNR